MKLYTKHHTSGLITDVIEVSDDVVLPVAWKLQTEAFRLAYRAGDPVQAPVRWPAVPVSVPSAQLRQWLVDNNLLDAVEAAFAFIPDEKVKKKAQQRWEYEINYKRDDPLVVALGQMVGLSPEQVDQAFIQASSYE